MFTTDQWLPWRQNGSALHGRGYIAGESNPDPDGIDGIVTVNDVPGAREVEIRERKTRRVVAVGFSNADGTYRFDGLNPDIEFDVIARDWSRIYTDVIQPARRPATRPLMQSDTWDVPIGVPFRRRVPVSYGVGTVTVSITGTLPSGLTATDATISGAWPTGTPGDYPLTVSAEDAVEQTASATVLLRLVLLPLEIVTPLPVFIDSVPASVTLVARGGEGPYTYAVTAGSLPAGLSLNGSTGEISGTPTTPGAYSFEITATDVRSATASKTYSGAVFEDTPYRWWRVYITEANSGGYGAICELEFLDGNGVRYSLAGGTPVASSEFDASHSAAYAFDGLVNNDAGGNIWAPSNSTPPSWLGYQHANAVDVRAIRITARATAYAAQSPKAFAIQYSDDGSTWTTVWSESGQTGWTGYEQRTFTRP